LLQTLLSIEIEIPTQGIMSLRSAFNRLFAKVAADEAAIADISGNRIPALVSETSANAAADALRQAIQDAKDATQDTATAAAQLAAASAAMDIAAVADRVTALEGAPAFDATAITGRLDAAEAAIGGKADTTYVDAGLAAKAATADLSALDTRVAATEAADSAAAGRLDALEAAVPSKVAQADYDVAIASLTAAAGAAQSTADGAATAAAAAAAAVAGKEDMGRLHKTDYELVDVSGVNAAYWAGSLNATIGNIVAAGKVAMFRADGANTISHFLNVADAAVAGDTYRFSNKSAEALWAIVLGSQGGQRVEVLPGETVTVVSAGSQAWNIL
jgi:hypothetical protein